MTPFSVPPAALERFQVLMGVLFSRYGCHNIHDLQLHFQPADGGAQVEISSDAALASANRVMREGGHGIAYGITVPTGMYALAAILTL